LDETFDNIAVGLLVAVVAIFLLLAANFQSFRLAFVVVFTVPAVLAGVVVMLRATGTTLNVQSFMGAIMAVGVAVANAILLVTFAEHARRLGGSPRRTGIDAAAARMRPVLMTSAAMIAGMVPDGPRARRGCRGDGAPGPCRHRRAGRRDRGHPAGAALGVFDRAADGGDGLGVARSRRPRERVRNTGAG
jgi:hypothetical protein